MATLFTRLSLLLITCVVAITGAAQKTERYYDVNWKLCSAADACYFSVVSKTDSGYLLQDYFVNSSRPQMIALYEDSALKIMNGHGTWYYANGRLARIGYAIHNNPEGTGVAFHPNGFISDSANYHNGQPTGTVYKWYINGYLSDSVSNIRDSTDVHISWFDDGVPASAGREIKGKNIGTWVFYHHNGQKASVELYENDKVLTTKHFDERGTEVATDTNRVEKAAIFKNGVKDWVTYLERNLIWPLGYQFENRDKVVMKVNFTINEAGKVEDVYIVTPVHPAFDKVAFDVVSKSPLWKPAVQHNRNVKYRFTQTVTFAQP